MSLTLIDPPLPDSDQIEDQALRLISQIDNHSNALVFSNEIEDAYHKTVFFTPSDQCYVSTWHE